MSRGLEGWLESVWYPRDGAPAAGALLAPAGWIFRGAVAVRNLAYDRGWADAVSLPVPVISVGNLAVGGAGKTPVVLEVVRRLVAAGERPAILTRGYGGRRPTVERVSPDASGQEVGDEAVMVARRLPEAMVLVGGDRIASGRRAVAAGATVLVLDDGMQHRRLRRDVEIVVVDGARGLGNRRHLPAGPLREGPGALDRANLLWVTRVDEGEGPQGSLGPPELPVVRSRYVPMGLTPVEGGRPEPAAWLTGRRVVPLAGIARPASFLHSLRALGARLEAPRLYPDHHPFTEAEVGEALAEARARDARVVTTEKDAARLPPGTTGVHVLAVQVEVLEGEPHLQRVLERVCGSGPA